MNLDLFSAYDYTALCNNANEAVKDFTWDNYIGKVIGVIG